MYTFVESCAALFRMTARAEYDLAGPLGVAIRKHRCEQGLSQLQLAERAGCHINQVGYIERGTRQPSLPMLGRFLRALNLTLEQLARTGKV